MKTTHILKMNASNVKKGIQVESKIREFCGRKTGKKYSFFNKSDMEVLFYDLVKFSGLPSYLFKDFGIRTSNDIKNLLMSNEDALKEDGWSFSAIKTLDDTEREKEYKLWKKSSNYRPGKSFRGMDASYEEPEEELVRIIVVYDANYPGNPDTTLEYEFTGKIGKETEHQLHMIRYDYSKLTGIRYMKSNTQLLSGFLNRTEEQLKRRESNIDNSDLD